MTVDKNIKNGTVTATVPKTQNIKWSCYGSLPYLDDKTEDFSDTVTASKGDTVALGIICNTDNAYAEYIAVCGDSWNETERVKGLVGHGELSYDTAITYDGKATSVYRFKFYGASLGASFCGRYTLTINWTDDATAKAGETVTLNATPDKGYVLKELTAKTSDGKEISVDKNNSFVMPDSDVTVSAEFVKQPCTVLRAAGNNRFATAAAISKLSFDKVDTVIIAYGYEYADALAGIPLAAKFNAPILLTHTKFIPNETLDEIKRLGAKKAFLLGGEGVISKNSEESLKKAGLDTERIAGKTRFGTAAAIAEKVSDAPEEIFFVYGLEYADALSVNPIAGYKQAPIIYLHKNGDIDADTAAYLVKVKGKVRKAYVIGGTGVISDEMMKKAAKAVGVDKPIRVYGKNRYLTCVAINEQFKDVLSGEMICVATGNNFPDALAGGMYAAIKQAPMMLINTAIKKPSYSEEQAAYLKAKIMDKIVVFGGTGVVPDEFVTALADAAGRRIIPKN